MAKKCLIVGGTSGLGFALAADALKRGMHVTVCGRSANAVTAPPELNGAEFFQFDLEHLEAKALDRIGDTRADYFVWAAGQFVNGFFDEHGRVIDAMVTVNFTGPLILLRKFMRGCLGRKQEFHLVTIASTSAWRLRKEEALYASLTSAKAAFTRQLANELPAGHPGSKATTFCPGGMQTKLYRNTPGVDTSKFMDPAELAASIWARVLDQTELYQEWQIHRQPDGSPRWEEGVKLPEIPESQPAAH